MSQTYAFSITFLNIIILLSLNVALQNTEASIQISKVKYATGVTWQEKI